MRLLRYVGLVGVLAVVGVAFADSSVVVLALPALLRQFGMSVTTTSTVIVAYNAALAVTALALIRTNGRHSPRRLVAWGSALFLISSLACGAAHSFWLLIAARAVQGLGGAFVLVGGLPLAVSFAGSARVGQRAWSSAAVLGTAVGPACGGALTGLLSWRAIFFAQAPLPVLALIATALPSRRSLDVPVAGRARVAVIREFALALISAALVGLLFIAVVMLIDVWGLSPLAAAAAVSAIPIGTLAARSIPCSSERQAGVIGSLLLALGLGGMALIPSLGLVWVVVALLVAGVGVGLVVAPLGEANAGDAIVGARVVFWRHAGVVIGLLLLTPLLAADLQRAERRARLEGIAVVLNAPTAGRPKIKLALALVPVLTRPARDGIPDFKDAVAEKGDRSFSSVGAKLDTVVRATITRGFRRAFALGALFALFALPFVVSTLDGPRSGVPPPRWQLFLPAFAAALLLTELAAGATSFGERPRLYPPCSPRASVEGQGLVQKGFLAGLDALSCRLHTTREELLAHAADTQTAHTLMSYLDGNTGGGGIARLFGLALSKLP